MITALALLRLLGLENNFLQTKQNKTKKRWELVTKMSALERKFWAIESRTRFTPKKNTLMSDTERDDNQPKLNDK